MSAVLGSGLFALAVYAAGFVGVFLTAYRVTYREWAKDGPVDNADRAAALYIAAAAGFIWPAALVLLGAYFAIRPVLQAIEAEEDDRIGMSEDA